MRMTLQAMGSMEGGVVNDDYGRLLDGMESLLPVGLKERVTKHFGYVLCLCVFRILDSL